jgi:valyl-tRNA synthetase
VTSARVVAPASSLALLESAAADLAAVGRIAELSFAAGDELAVADIVLAEQPAEA